MKRKLQILALMLTLLLTAFSMEATAKDKRTVERGMTKQEVMSILGTPKASSFDQTGTRWEYIKSKLLDPYDVYVRIEFDNRDRVVNYQETIIPRQTGNQNNTIIGNPTDEFRRPYPGFYDDCLTENEFTILYDRMNKANFDDNRMALLEVACLRCLFTCRQSAQLLKLFSFSDGKLKALRFMARQIVDPQNAYVIYQSFTFDSDKDKAARIMHEMQMR